MNYWGFFTAAGAVTAVLWLLRHHDGLGLSENEFWASIWVLLIGAVAGAKILFLILGWEHYARGELRFWADFDVGFVFFGGLLGAAGAGLIFSRIRGLSYVRGADYYAVAIPIGHAIGRIGCFFNGCCSGRPPHPVHALICRVVLARVESEKAQRGTAFRCYLILYGLLRFLLDPLRADGRPERFFGLSHQQLIALSIVVAVFAWHHMAYSRSSAPNS
jgi:phosphatidylglycerol:prolipoprotein diacylglycerol transferase